jgi:hypothetical protein
MLRKLIVVAALALSGCGFGAMVAPVIAHVIAAATQAGTILDMIESDASRLPLNQDQRVKLDRAIADCRLTLAAAYSAANGADAMTKEQADMALADFRNAWEKLVPVLKDIGLMKVPGKLGASPDVTPIPEPIALKRYSGS